MEESGIHLPAPFSKTKHISSLFVRNYYQRNTGKRRLQPKMNGCLKHALFSLYNEVFQMMRKTTKKEKSPQKVYTHFLNVLLMSPLLILSCPPNEVIPFCITYHVKCMQDN